jgi:hypothetical protein
MSPIKASTLVASPTVKARVGQQNVTRVLSNASSPPAKLIDLNDVNSMGFSIRNFYYGE